jgi:hypothetical protein
VRVRHGAGLPRSLPRTSRRHARRHPGATPGAMPGATPGATPALPVATAVTTAGGHAPGPQRLPSSRSGSPARGARTRSRSGAHRGTLARRTPGRSVRAARPVERQEPQRCSPWHPRASDARTRSARAARPVEHAPVAAAVLTVEPSRVGRPAARLGPWSACQGRSGAHRGTPRASEARPARSGSPACGARARSRSSAHRPLSRSDVRQVASDAAGRNSAAARRYVAREAGTRRVSTRPRRGEHPPQDGRGRETGVTRRLLLFPVAAL